MRAPKWQLAIYALIIFCGLIAALPNLVPPNKLGMLPNWLQTQHVTLGLDLQGGSHLVLEVDGPALKHERLTWLQDETRRLLRQERVSDATPRLQGDAVVIVTPDAETAGRVETLVSGLATPVQTGGFTPTNDILVARDGTQLNLTLSQAGLDDRVNQAIDQSLEIVRQRVDQVGVAEPTIQRVGSDRIMVQLPGLQDPTRLRELLGSTAQMSFHMVAGSQSGPGISTLQDDEGNSYPIEDSVALSGERLVDARAGFDQRSHEPLVSFRFDSVGTQRFAEITQKNVGRPFAIVLDGKVLSAPVIREPITGGSGQISGSFTVEDTVVLSALLRAGALPAPLTVIEERTVGPDLGADVIRTGIVSGIAGFVLVVGLMVGLYGGWGLIASGALLLNVILTLGALGLLGATLTLPGIAGIILGIGIAVDANILINERIKEEAARGKSAFAALDQGFNRAYSTIVDANVTSLIATLLLFMFGTGPVRGFAVTMLIGIVLSMFTAVAVVRIAMTEVVRRRRMKTLTIRSPFKFKPRETHFRFMRARYLGIGMSIFLSIASIVLFIKPGLNYGIDFTGGIQAEISTSQSTDLAALRSGLGELGLGEVSLQTVGSGDSVLVRLPRQEGGEAAQTAAIDQVRTKMAELDPGSSVDRTEVVGPKVSGELARNGVIAVVLASLAMLVYIWWRFEWYFAVGAIVTLVLDTTKTVGFFALTGLDFNLTAIAALLTIIGYSVNDKVVVYDRMRENLRLYKKMTLRDVIDMSINQVLLRCVFTSLTTFLAILPLAIWGGNSVANFAIPMVFGVVVATTSSIFIAAPILLLLGDWAGRRRARQVDAVPLPAE
ncbi:protein translocase subunit SecD [Rhizobium sp. EC-SD404]|uniref:protein translocase subunit SecD n=1 Tax=Rhizobium sp. EC-SD404 TaxID=2038389 RepID=UPI0012560DA6|nr:protein translocase subunit SecD [Rhizobium sp. EC-SD404]VVT25541.1 Protein translocase subunit SecD / Protein-export membrane protein SecF [Rhizobium sp. EC-SD404]